MKISDLLDKKSIELCGVANSKTEALDKAIDLICKSGKIKNREEYRKKVFKREDEGSTGVGGGIAIPHGKCGGVLSPALGAIVLKDGVDFDSLDGEKVRLIFIIAAADTKENLHLDVLSRLSVMMMNEEFSERLINAESVEEFLEIIDREEEKENKKQLKAIDEKFEILAVTGCPTGIAHTYMAAEALEKAAKKLGTGIKVETRGSGGAKNILTDEEIKNAKAVIVAVDTKVPMERFNGKKVIIVSVSEGIGKADKLVEKALKGEATEYKAKGEEKSQNLNSGHGIYTQLMNGVSHMLPFVVGGGILIAIAFLIDGFCVDLDTLSPDKRGDFGTITPAAAFFKGVGGAAFGLMLPVLAGYIGMAIADRPGLAVGFVGGMIASGGKSGFLGALAAGFAAGFIIMALKKAFSGIPEALDGIKPVLIYPLLGIFAMGLFMYFIVEPFVGAINTGLNTFLSSLGNTSKVIVGIIVGAMMAVDMGGPVNKAAYVFGTASIAAGNYYIMAAVMIGGMVPPCAIALSSFLFRDKFTEEERKSAPTGLVMGLSFITEGAIPYAASDPVRVIPASIAGAGIAGGLSAVFGCTLMAPHGGIFVFPVVEHPLLYIFSLAVGTVVSALILGFFKNTKTEMN